RKDELGSSGSIVIHLSGDISCRKPVCRDEDLEESIETRPTALQSVEIGRFRHSSCRVDEFRRSLVYGRESSLIATGYTWPSRWNPRCASYCPCKRRSASSAVPTFGGAPLLIGGPPFIGPPPPGGTRPRSCS